MSQLPGFSDPLADVYRRLSDPYSVLQAQQRPQPALPPFPQQEEESMLGRMTNDALGGLGYLGKILDKSFGGRAVRGLLGGNPRELLSPLPLSDTLGITNENDIVSGRKLLENASLLQPKAPGEESFDWGDVAGMAAEIGLDPSMWLHPIPLTQAGEAAAKLGLKAPSWSAAFHGVNDLADFGRSAAKVQGPVGVADAMGAPLRHLAGVGLPFMGPAATFGEAPAWLGGALDTASGLLNKSAPVRYAKALLAPSVGRALTPEIQELHAAVRRPAEADLMSGVLGQAYDFRKELEPLLRYHEPEVLRYVTRAAEGVPVPQDLASYAADLQARAPDVYNQLQQSGAINNIAQSFPQLQDIGQRVGQAFRDFAPAEQALGVQTPELEDTILRGFGKPNTPQDLLSPRERDTVQYVMRRMGDLEGPRQGEGLLNYVMRRGKQILDTSHSSQAAREEILKGFPGGTTQINDLVKMIDQGSGNPLLVGPDRALNDLQTQEYLRRQLTGTSVPPQDSPAWKQAEKLNEYFRDLDPRRAQTGLFDPDILSNLQIRGGKSAKVRSAAEAIHEGVSQFAKPVQDFGDQPVVRVPELLRSAGLGTEYIQGGPVPKALEIAAQKLGLSKVEDLANYAVPESMAKDMSRWLTAWTRPEELSPILKAYDAATNMFKGLVTAPFPSNAARWLTTGLFNMWRDDALDLGAMRDASALMRGHPLSEPIPGVPDVIRSAIQNRVAFTGGGQAKDLLTSAEGALPRLSQSLPGVATDPARIYGKLADLAQPVAQAGASPVRLSDLARQVGLDTPNELKALTQRMGLQSVGDLATLAVPAERVPDVLGKGVGEAATDWAKGFVPDTSGGIRGVLEQTIDPTAQEGVRELGAGKGNVVVSTMRQLGENQDDWMRLSHYIAKLRQGFSEPAAAEAVTKYHFDYGDLSQFEKSVMKRVFPFWTWSSRNLPNVLEDLATKPGKLTASIRAGTRPTRSPDEFVPDYLGESVAIPIPGAPEGSQRFISSFGSPVEDEFLAALGSVAHGRISRTLGELMGGANPAIKLPIELATGTQLHSGRQLTDLKPTAMGSAFGLLSDEYAHPATEILANTPLTRFASTLDKLTDTRKGIPETAINLGTGARITDVDLERQKEIMARSVIEDALRGTQGVQTFSNFAVKPENIPLLSQAQIEMLRLQKGLEQRGAQRAREAKIAVRGG